MTLRTVLLGALIAIIPATALAEGPDPEARAARRARILERFDADGDGKLTGAEKRKAKRAKQRMKRQRRMARRFDKLIQKHDHNGDGILTEAEVGSRFAKLRRFDKNGDGWLTRDELPRKLKRKRAPRAGN